MALRPQDPKSPTDKAAEREAAQQEVFMREVDDALREDEVMGMFRRYGKPVLAIVGLGLMSLAGYLWWENDQTAKAEERGEQMIVALDELEVGKTKEADAQLASLIDAAGGAGGSAIAAKLVRAGIALEDGRAKDAVKLYDEVASDTDAPQPYRDLAVVRGVAADFDNLAPDAVVTRLKPLAAPGNPWFGVAGELLGVAYLKQEKPELAGPLFAQIARDETLPDSLRGRARQMAGLLGVDAVDDPAEDDDAAADDTADETAGDED